MRLDYLTDEELSKMIEDIEANDLVTAPPDLEDNILLRLTREHGEEPDISKKMKDRRTLSFTAYSIRVAIAVAAAIAVLILVPVGDKSLPKIDTGKVTADIEIMPKEGILHIIGSSKNIFKGDTHFLRDFIGGLSDEKDKEK
ncbi:MAG: hypothetical protein IKX99_03420 [Lachnospiraceae bacterium]|nr:hypothetical protein [Lachnospiraceae bacterium]MBO4461958.1 hypothetical protein [Lachnospiraceae bacterium]MBR4795744.1 hypothetical protein [Lachnospiraceae bacterium]MBR5789139.1 hypothetical protein [Lachnospiraceae bacterium]